MKKRKLSRVDPKSFDWSKVDATSDADIARQIAQDGEAAPDMSRAARGVARVVRPPAAIDVKRIRRRLGLSQRNFALRFGFRTRTIQEWEQRRRLPEGPARILLMLIEKEPGAVERALSDA